MKRQTYPEFFIGIVLFKCTISPISAASCESSILNDEISAADAGSKKIVEDINKINIALWIFIFSTSLQNMKPGYLMFYLSANLNLSIIHIIRDFRKISSLLSLHI
ncbi:MAG: hypothetical protein PHP13_00670 [Methanomicrobium sp.]|nr:hypothetical protein [Methanomicrobium sp.]MDD4299152.1 hypothetical protein [Methanomicrobium sp.]